MKETLTDMLKARLLVLLNRWEKQTKVVKSEMEKYLAGEDINRIQISKDVTFMKDTFGQIDGIMKNLK